VRAHDVPVDPAPTAFEDLAVLVDQKVVTDVVPAVREHVVALDPAHDRRRLRAAVRVRADRVVDERKTHRVRIRRLLAPPDLLVRAPGGPGDDQRRPRLRECPQPILVHRAPDVVRTDTADPAGGAHLDPSRRSSPVRAPELPRCVRPGIGPVVLGLRGVPAAPAPVGAPRPKRDGAAPLPVQADQVEPVSGSIDAGTHVVGRERRAGRERGAGRHDQQQKG
jgi:hypothetical protein